MTETAQTFVRGIDVSIYQGAVNWAQVAADGIEFAFIRASHGITGDTTFPTNWSGARAVKVKRGAYHYFIPTDDVQAQVDLFVKTVGKLSPGDLAPALDLENPAAWDSIAKADRLPLVLKWLNAVEAALGIRPMIYCSLNFIGQVFDDATALSAYPLWIAFYATADLPTIPSIWSDWLFWQWSSKGTVAGITGAVDLDRFRGTSADLAKLGLPELTSGAADSSGTSSSIDPAGSSDSTGSTVSTGSATPAQSLTPATAAADITSTKRTRKATTRKKRASASSASKRKSKKKK